jgi:hypothetical protein
MKVCLVVDIDSCELAMLKVRDADARTDQRVFLCLHCCRY